MGCDIHSMAEVYRKRSSWDGVDRGGRWVPLDTYDEEGIFDNAWYDAERPLTGYNKPKRTAPLDDRNYVLFGLLANVRNGGFAGVSTGDAVRPLSEPRGVPADASHAWLAEVDQWDVDMHSQSWFLLPELIDNPLYDQRLVRRGVINGLQYEKLRDEGGTPGMWAGAVSGRDLVNISIEEYEAGIRARSFSDEEIASITKGWRAGAERLQQYLDPRSRTYVEYVWEDKLRDNIGELLSAVERLKEYADGSNEMEERIPYEHVRIVFGFDN